MCHCNNRYNNYNINIIISVIAIIISIIIHNFSYNTHNNQYFNCHLLYYLKHDHRDDQRIGSIVVLIFDIDHHSQEGELRLITISRAITSLSKSTKS
jgi:hypothetical protein